jgi:hypothetical protein
MAKIAQALKMALSFRRRGCQQTGGQYWFIYSQL